MGNEAMHISCRLLLLSIAWAGMAHADEGDAPEVVYPVLPAQGATLEAFVPKGWRMEFVKRGDLDGDKREDAVFVLRMQHADNILENDGLGTDLFDTNPRILGAAFADGEGYRLAVQDHALIPRPDSPTMDDYLESADSLVVRRGAFAVTLHAWSSAGSWDTSNTTFTFRYQDNCFRLIGYDDRGTNRGSGQTSDISVNYLTRKATIAIGSIEDDVPVEHHHRTLPAQALRCLQDVGDGFEFDSGVRAE
jgi:hypothetical protein